MSRDLNHTDIFPQNFRDLSDKVYDSAQFGIWEMHEVFEKSIDHVYKTTQAIVDSLVHFHSSMPVVNVPISPPPTATKSAWNIGYWRCRGSDLWNWVTSHKMTVMTIMFLGAGAIVFVMHTDRQRRLKKARLRKRCSKVKDIVVVTGADTQLGQTIATYLSRRGFTVYATVKDESTLGHLEQRPELKGLHFDPTSAASLESMKSILSQVLVPSALIHENRTGTYSNGLPSPKLVGLVHIVPSTAISTSYAPVESISTAQYQHALTYPLTSTTTTFQLVLPIMRRAVMREPSYSPLVMLLSPSNPTPARIHLGMPFASAGVASHHALLGLMSSLRREVAPLGIGVTFINLGFVQGSLNTPSPYDIEGPTMNEDLSGAYGKVHGGIESSRQPTSHTHIASRIYDMLVLAGENGRNTPPPEIVDLGSGAGLYRFVGTFAPTKFIDWITGTTWRRSHRTRHRQTKSGNESDDDYVSI